MLRYFRGSLVFAALSLAAAAWLGFETTGSLTGTFGVLWIVIVLSVLEVSLSFDNAVVNATVLRDMSAIWQRRFLTWGIVIAVFGMRIVFPLAIVAIAARLDPVTAVKLAATDPITYERLITGARIGISGFGGAFLAMVGIGFFVDEEKHDHWLRPIERPLAGLSRVPGLSIGIALAALLGVSRLLPAEDALSFLVSGMFSLLTYIAVQAFNVLMARRTGGADGIVVRSGLAAFMYLEVLDASFSFDGVIGAFALSNNLFVIALGLGIGAMFVRSMTIMLVEKGTLSAYRFLEHGAFYAIIALATIMLLSARFHIPETITGLIGAGFILLALWASIRNNRRRDDGGVTINGGGSA